MSDAASELVTQLLAAVMSLDKLTLIDICREDMGTSAGVSDVRMSCSNIARAMGHNLATS